MDKDKEERLDALLRAMKRGKEEIGTTLALREIAEYADRMPADNHVSSVLMDLLLLIRQGYVQRLSAETRCYDLTDAGLAKVAEDAEAEEAA